MVGDPLPKKWHWTTLADVQDQRGRAIVSGPFGSNIGSRFFVESGVPVIRGNNLTTDLTRFVERGFVYLTEEKASEFKNCEAVRGDLVLTAAGSLGQVGIIPDNSLYDRYIISNKQLRARVDATKVLPIFAFYWLSSPEMVAYIQQRNTGSTVPLINLSVLRQLPVPLPPLSEQKRIIDILGSLDDMIELNRKMNETLETMARAIFKSWFVDFDPVVAKSEGRQPEGMDAETAKLFPDSFEDSEIGRVPKGWKVKPLTQLIEVNPYRQLARGKTAPYLDMAALPTNSARPQTATARAFSSGSKFKNGDTLLARITPCLENGKTGFVDNLAEGQVGWGSTEFIVLCPKASLPPCYAYFLARTEEFRAFAIANMTGTSGRQRVVVESLAHYLIVDPPQTIAQVFGEIASCVLRKMRGNDNESISLASVRDILLPKLLTGEMAIPIANDSMCSS